jgi:hypothetical protein
LAIFDLNRPIEHRPTDNQQFSSSNRTSSNKIESRYNKAKAMPDKLPQSILARAFRGELVAQDPNDEPAGVLVERIKKGKR